MNRDALHEATLDNGLRVLVMPVTTAPLVSVWCWYHVGSKDESPGQTGISHFVEHMNFKGTRGVSREDLKVWIERAGGMWNGYTWIDQTTYFETLAADELDLALRIESERMNECLYEPHEFESERSVVLAELHGNRNDPQYLLDVEVSAAALRMHPYRWPTIGWTSDLERMTRDDLWEYYRRWYVPSNATLVIAGDVDAEAAAAAVDKAFGGLDAGRFSRPAIAPEPAPDGERRVVVERPGTTGYVQVAYPAPAFADPDFVAMLVADAILSGGKGINLWSGGFGRSARRTAPLYAALVETELVVSVGSAILPTEHPYLYTVSATLRTDAKHRQVENALFAAIDQLATAGPDEQAMIKARNQILSSIAFESERVTEIGHQLGYYATIADLDTFFAVPERVADVSPEDVQRVLRRYLRPDARTVGWFVPQGSA